MTVPHRGPRWRAGLSAALSAVPLVLAAEIISALTWLQVAADTGRNVDTSLAWFPGSRVYNLMTTDGGSFGWQPGWMCLAVGLLVFLIVARPWRLGTGRGRAAGDQPLTA